MGFVRGAVFKVVKKVLGIIQIRLNEGNDIVIREETLKDINYEERKTNSI